MSRKNRIEEVLNQHLLPIHLHIDDESGSHHVPEGSESHFKVTAISTQFTDLTPVQRHRVVNELLKNEFNLGLHALSMHLFTPEEWEKRTKSLSQSPSCKDGFQK